MKRALITVALLGLSHVASADAPKLQVLQTEGRADAATRAKIDATILKLASTSNAQVSTGDITFSDAAAGVGCKPDTAACRDEVLGMLGIDEIVYATATPKPGGIEVVVHRFGKGGADREGRSLVPSGQPPDRLDGAATLFITASAPPTTTTVEPPATTTTSTTAPPLEPLPPGDSLPPSLTSEPPAPVVVTAPVGPSLRADTGEQPHRRLKLAGMIGGGALAVIGFLCWGAASDLQDEIDASPTATAPQLAELHDLEARADSYAGWGNALFLGGAVIGGISTYYFIKGRRAQRTTSARLTPTVFDHGAGLALTFGGTP